MTQWQANWKRSNDTLKNMGLWFRKYFPPTTTIAATWLGRVPYYSGFKTIDMLGLADEHIAHKGFVDTAQTKQGHRKRDPKYVLSRAPDVVLVEVLPRTIGDARMEEVLTTTKLLEFIKDEAAANALHYLIALRDFRLNYEPVLRPLETKGFVAFFARTTKLMDKIRETPANSSSPKWFFELSLLLRKHGLLLDAIEASRNSIRLNPGPVVARMNLAYLLLDAKQYSSAISEFELILTQDPNHSSSRYGLALSFQKAHRYREAITQWRQFIGKNKDNRFAGKARAFLEAAEQALKAAQDNRPR